jgi:hypothetical protein
MLCPFINENFSETGCVTSSGVFIVGMLTSENLIGERSNLNISLAQSSNYISNFQALPMMDTDLVTEECFT